MASQKKPYTNPGRDVKALLSVNAAARKRGFARKRFGILRISQRLTARARAGANGVRNPRFHENGRLWIPAFAGMTGEKSGMAGDKWGMAGRKSAIAGDKSGTTAEKSGMTGRKSAMAARI